ncbi:MAG: hypothetical protein EXR99_09265 [Gemmataceae bacterium]|nr:hypothetical protein [Gemmataceae bacterium]
MAGLASKFKGKAEFLFVYCREAHPEGDKRFNTKTKGGKAIGQAASMEERLAIAKAFCEDLKAERTILVDEFNQKSVQRAYGGLPNPTVVVDVDGKIAMKMAWTNGQAVESYLKEFLKGGGKVDRALAEKVPQGRPMIPNNR